jgi:hypothetical protein
MTQVTVDINTDKAFATVQDFINFTDKISYALNKAYIEADRLEKLGISAGKYQKEGLETFATHLSELLADYAL